MEKLEYLMVNKKLLDTLENEPEKINNKDMIIVRYEGPVGGPGMPEMLDSTSRITSLCREKDIIVGLMTDGRFFRWFCRPGHWTRWA